MGAIPARMTRVGISSYTARWMSQFAISVPGRCIVVADDDPVAHFDESICKRNEFGIVSDENNRLLKPAIQLPEHVQNDCRILRIQAACRLVGEQNRRFVRDGPSNCDALLFATRKFGRLASHLILDHEELESLGQMVVM